MTPHRIRLSRPWQCEPSPQGTRWRRSFNRPTGLGPRNRVWIVVGQCATAGAVSINDHAIGRLASGESVRFDATDRLQLHNELVLDLVGRLPDAWRNDQPPVEVSLEIEAIS